jgi:major tropism determinant Mtd-like protein
LSEQLQLRRGSASQVAAFTGAQGEVVVDTTNNRLVVQDGATAGGFAAAKLSETAPTASPAFTGAPTAPTPATGDSSTRIATTAFLAQNLPGGSVNKFRNATMDVWQRGTSSIAITTAGGYSADGWIIVPTGASVTVAQAGGRLLTKASLQVTGATSVTDVVVKQRIESLIAAALCSQTVTVQAQVYNNTGAAITPTLTVKHAGTQDIWTSPATDVSAVNLQSCASGAWTQVAYTFAASAYSYNGLEVSFDFGANFGSGSKTVQIAELDVRTTPGVAIGLNSNPPPPELRPIAAETAFCQRYFETSYQLGAAPGAVNSAAGSSWFFMSGLASAAYFGGQYVGFKATKMATPALTIYSPVSGAPGKVRDAQNNADVPAFTQNAGEAGFQWYAQSSAASVGVQLWAHWTASSEL